MNKREEVFGYLKGLASIDLSGTEIKDELILQEVNRVDLSDAEGERVTVKAEFVNCLDLSGGDFDKVVLEGAFNIVDVSDATIGTLDVTQAEISILDDSGADIREVRRKE